MPLDEVEWSAGDATLRLWHGGRAAISNGDRLLAFDTTVILGALTAEPRDVVRYDGASYSLELDGSNAGIPGLQIPAGLGPETKLPVGIELDGPAGSDRRLIALGLAMKKILGRLPAPAHD